MITPTPVIPTLSCVSIFCLDTKLQAYPIKVITESLINL